MQPDEQKEENKEQAEPAISDNKYLITEEEKAPVEKPELSEQPPAPTENKESAEPAISDNKYLIHDEDKTLENTEQTETPPVVEQQKTEPETTPPVASTPSPVTSDEVIEDKHVAPPPPSATKVQDAGQTAPTEQKSHITENQIKRDELTPEQKVEQLTEEELDAARRLWAKKHIAEAQKIANQNRHKRMLERMDELEKFVKANPESSVHELANKINLSEKLTSGYLQKLVHAGRIKASGNTNSRRFSK